jgi:hypothetical protein
LWNSLTDTQRKADLIAVGSIVDGSETGATASFTLRIARVLKGDPSLAGKDLLAEWALAGGLRPAGSPAPLAPENGLWFLQRQPGAWAVVPAMQGDIRFFQTFVSVPAGGIPAAYSYAAEAPLADKLASEIGAATEADNGGGTDTQMLFWGTLDDLKSAVLQVMYHRLANSSSPNARALGLAGLIRNGDTTALAIAYQQNAVFSNPNDFLLLLAIRDAFRTTDPDAIATLGQVAVDSKSVTASMRQACAHALASIHTKDALPYLAQLFDDGQSFEKRRRPAFSRTARQLAS